MGIQLVISNSRQLSKIEAKLKEYQYRGKHINSTKIEILKILVDEKEVAKDDPRLWGIDPHRLQVAWDAITEVVKQTRNSDEET
jgi:hypothetical protein